MSKAVVKMCVLLTESGRKKHGFGKLVLAGVISYAEGSGVRSHKQEMVSEELCTLGYRIC